MEYVLESTTDKLNYLAETKEEIADAITEKQQESYDAHTVFIIDLARSKRRLSSLEKRSEDDPDFEVLKNGETKRIGNTDYQYFLREDGCFVIITADYKWVLPKGIIVDGIFLSRIEGVNQFADISTIIDEEITSQQDKIFAFVDDLENLKENIDSTTRIGNSSYSFGIRNDGKYFIVSNEKRYLLPEDIEVDDTFKTSLIEYDELSVKGSEYKVIDNEIRRQRYITSDDSFRSYTDKINKIRIPESVPKTITKNGVYRAPENTGYSPLNIEIPSDPNGSGSKSAIPVSVMPAGNMVMFNESFSEWYDIEGYTGIKFADYDETDVGTAISTDEKKVYILLSRDKLYLRRYSTVKIPEEYYYLKASEIDGVFEEITSPEGNPNENFYYEISVNKDYHKVNKKDIKGSPIENGLYERSGDKGEYSYTLTQDETYQTGKSYYMLSNTEYDYKISEDTSVQSGKKYYQKYFYAEDEYYEKVDAGDLQYELVEEPEGSPKENGYYEKELVDKYYKIRKPYGSPAENDYYERNESSKPFTYTKSIDVEVDADKNYYKLNQNETKFVRSKDESVNSSKEYYNKIEKEDIEDIYYFDYELHLHDDEREEIYELTSDQVVDENKTYYEQRLKGANPWILESTVIIDDTPTDTYMTRLIQDKDIGLIVVKKGDYTWRFVVLDLLTGDILHDFTSGQTALSTSTDINRFHYFDGYICINDIFDIYPVSMSPLYLSRRINQVEGNRIIDYSGTFTYSSICIREESGKKAKWYRKENDLFFCYFSSYGESRVVRATKNISLNDYIEIDENIAFATGTETESLTQSKLYEAIRLNLNSQKVEECLIDFNSVMRGGIDYPWFESLPNDPTSIMRFVNDEYILKTRQVAWKNANEFFVFAKTKEHFVYDFAVTKSVTTFNLEDISFIKSTDTKVVDGKKYYLPRSPKQEEWVEIIYSDDYFDVSYVEKDIYNSSRTYHKGDLVSIDGEVYVVTAMIILEGKSFYRPEDVIYPQKPNVELANITDDYYEYDDAGNKTLIMIPEFRQKLKDPIYRYLIDPKGYMDKFGITDMIEGDEESIQEGEKWYYKKFRARVPLDKFGVISTDTEPDQNKKYYMMRQVDVDYVNSNVSPKMKGWYIRDSSRGVSYEKIENPIGAPNLQKWYELDDRGNYVPSKDTVVFSAGGIVLKNYYRKVLSSSSSYSYVKTTDEYPSDVHTYYTPVPVINASSDTIELLDLPYDYSEYAFYFDFVENPTGNPSANGYYESNSGEYDSLKIMKPMVPRPNQDPADFVPTFEAFDIGGYGWSKVAEKEIHPTLPSSNYYRILKSDPIASSLGFFNDYEGVAVHSWDLLADILVLFRFNVNDISLRQYYRRVDLQHDIEIINGIYWGYGIMGLGHGYGYDKMIYTIDNAEDEKATGVLSCSISLRASSTGGATIGPFDESGNIVPNNFGGKSVAEKYSEYSSTPNEYLHYFIDSEGYEWVLVSFDRILCLLNYESNLVWGKIQQPEIGSIMASNLKKSKYLEDRAAVIISTNVDNEKLIAVLDYESLTWKYVSFYLRKIKGSDLFKAVDSPFGSPIARRYYEYSSDERSYKRSSDERVVSGKTYYEHVFYYTVYNDGVYYIATKTNDENFGQNTPKENGYYELKNFTEYSNNFDKVNYPFGSPAANGYYEKVGDKNSYSFVKSKDTVVNDAKTYYHNLVNHTYASYVLTEDEEYVSGKVYYRRHADDDLFAMSRMRNPYAFGWYEKKGKSYELTTDMKYDGSKDYYKLSSNLAQWYLPVDNPITMSDNYIIGGGCIFLYVGTGYVAIPNEGRINDRKALGYLKNDIYEAGVSQSIPLVVDEIDEVSDEQNS